jgi:hypothetical protein
MENYLGKIINKHALTYGLNPTVVGGLIMQESGGNIWAFRYEPGFYRKYLEGKPLTNFVPKSITKQSEQIARAFSYGLMQIMGQVAREYGFNSESLMGLLDPENNIQYGCMILGRKLLQQTGTEEERYRRALLRYNGGGDPGYPDKIFKRIERGEHRALF